MFVKEKKQVYHEYRKRLSCIFIYIIKQNIRIYIPYSWTDWADIFFGALKGSQGEKYLGLKNRFCFISKFIIFS